MLNKEEPQNNFSDIVDEYMQAFTVGSVVKGEVVKIGNDFALVNIGLKTEAIVPKEDFIRDGNSTVSEGEQIEAIVTNVTNSGQIKLSMKQLRIKKDFEHVKHAFDNSKFINVKIDKLDNKGYQGHFGELKAFILKNHIDFKNRVKDEKIYIGKTLPCKVLKINEDDYSFLASHRLYLEEYEKQKKAEFFKKVKVGDIVKGKVRTIKDYGVFIDLGSVDAFLYKDNISWGRVKHPTQYLEVDDMLEAKVINIDKEKEKIEVSLKHKTSDPWENVKVKYKEGSIVKGVIVTKKRNGFIVEVEEGIDGFIPEEEVSWFRTPDNKLNRRDVVEGRVTGYDDKNKRLIMSIRLATDNPLIDIKKRHPEGSIVKGTIKSIKDFGMFVDFGEPIQGLIKASDVSWNEQKANLKSLYTVGQSVEAKVLHIDTENGKILLGIKQLEANPWEDIDKTLPKGSVVEATVTAVDTKHIEVELPQKIKGIITVKELDEKKIFPKDKFKVGDVVKAVVLNKDTNKKLVFLSIRQYLLDAERQDVGEYLKTFSEDADKFNLGLILKDKLNKK